MLIVFSGLPGTGKTTIAQKLAARKRAVYLRIDTLEQTLRNAEPSTRDVGRTGYTLTNELALSNLQLGNTVIVDGVNPVAQSRNAWREIASRADARLFNVQVSCSDKAEHRRRVEQRQSDIPGLTPPSWSSVQAHDYEPWEDTPFSVDTAENSPEQAVNLIMQRLSEMDDGRYALFLSGPVGVGKTTLGKALATRLGGSFIDGDDLADAGRPWYGSIHSTCKAIARESVVALTQYPFVVIAYPLRCVNWIYFRRRLAEVGIRPYFITLRASYESIVAENRQRLFTPQEHQRIRTMIAEDYAERRFCDLVIDTDRYDFGTTLDHLEKAVREEIARLPDAFGLSKQGDGKHSR